MIAQSKHIGMGNTKVLALLGLYAFVVLFLVSPDSYTHDLNYHSDSAWFFMCGKAWMNGMVPYVDFADSKGILLWLIYGIGYIISPYNYLGIFWLSCILYTIVLYICYKIGLLLTEDQSKAFAVALLMAIAYHIIHYEIRAEDWSQIFVASSLYCLLKETLSPTNVSYRKAAVVIGVSFAATLLIKWTIAIMLLSIAASIAIILYNRKRDCWKYCGVWLLATTLFLLPFVVYMLLAGCIESFFIEYFYNTTQTVSSGVMESLKEYFFEWADLFRTKKIFYIIYLIAIWGSYKVKPTLTILPFLCCLFFMAICIRHDMGYYMNILNTFIVFIIALCVNYIPDRFLSSNKLCVIAILSIATISTNLFNHKNLFFHSEDRDGFYKAAYLMSQVDNPTIMNGGHEHGIGISVNSLPATKYWSFQNGATHSMIVDRKKAIERQVPDFITIQQKNVELQKIAGNSDYKYYLSYIGTIGDTILVYGRKGLLEPPTNFHVSDMEILLKKKISF